VSDRFSRNEALFGEEGQRQTANKKVAIVGLGGLGSHIAQQLAYLGVGHFALIDFDIVTESSLNRLIGAVESDIANETKKVAVAARLIQQVNSSASVLTLEKKLSDSDAEPLIVTSDVVFGCVDRDLARLQLTDMACRYAKPYFDLASDTGDKDDDHWYGGHIILSDGTQCLVCLNLLDQDEMNRDSMTLDQRAAHDRIYGVKREALGSTGPMVVSINGAVASIAVTEFMAYVTGLRTPFKNVIYRGDAQVIRKSLDEPEEGCYYCTGLWGTATNG
jgi:molybdopterin/thiamine biosynthesis adenylyltransferase